MKKLISVLLSSVFLITNVTGCQSKEVTENKIVAKAGDVSVNLRDFKYYFGINKASQDNYLDMFGYNDEQKLKYWQQKDESGLSPEDEIKEYALKLAENKESILKLAKDNKISLDSKEIKKGEKEVDNFIISLNSKEETGEKKLKKMYDITLQDLKNMQQDFLTIQKYVDSFKDQVKVTDDQIKKYYDEHKEDVDKKIDKQVTVKHILISTTLSDEDKKGLKENEIKAKQDKKNSEAEKKANELLNKIKNGEDIGKLAKEYSEDPGSKDNNGEYSFGRGKMVKEFEDWAFNAKPGDKGIVKTNYGYHVMECISNPTFKEKYDVYKKAITDIIKDDEAEKIVDEKVKNLKLNWQTEKDVYDSVKVKYETKEKPVVVDEAKNNKTENKDKNTTSNTNNKENNDSTENVQNKDNTNNKENETTKNDK